MSRPRKHNRKGWPEGLEAEQKANGVVYYRYRDSETKRSTSLGTDLAQAIAAVKVANAKRVVNQHEKLTNLVARIERPAITLGDFIEQKFWPHLCARRNRKGAPLSHSTLDQYRIQLAAIVADIGFEADAAKINRAQIAEFLDQRPPRSSESFRGLLDQLFVHLIAKGHREDNPVQLTERRVVVVERMRLTNEWYDAIYSAADPWFKGAMNLALYSLQRREDLARMKFEHFTAGVLTIRQHKVQNHGLGLIKIQAGVNLCAAIEQCRDPIVSPFIIHRRNQFKSGNRGDREHWSKVTPDQLTDTFRAIRDRLGICSDVDARVRPSFHEIRALGAEQMRLAGETESVIQLLLGHATEEMTQRYLSRHGAERWAEVRSR